MASAWRAMSEWHVVSECHVISGWPVMSELNINTFIQNKRETLVILQGKKEARHLGHMEWIRNEHHQKKNWPNNAQTAKHPT